MKINGTIYEEEESSEIWYPYSGESKDKYIERVTELRNTLEAKLKDVKIVIE